MRLGRLLGLFFFCLIASAGAAEGDRACRSVDLRPLLGPPHDQGDSGHCFAHSSADLITAKLGIRVSPLLLATSFILASPHELQTTDKRLLGRITPEFVEEWRKARNEEPENFTRDRILTEDGILFTGGEEVPTLFLANFFGLCAFEKLPSGEDVYLRYLSDIRRYHEFRTRHGDFPELELRGPIGEVQDPLARLMAWSFRHWVENRCGKIVRPREPILPSDIHYAKNVNEFRTRVSANELSVSVVQENLLRAVNEALDRRTPIAVGYSADDIMPADPRFPGGDHSSVLAARRRIGKECYYFLRNSYGEVDPEDYLPRFRNRLEQGGVWVRAKDLPSMYSAVWLE